MPMRCVAYGNTMELDGHQVIFLRIYFPNGYVGEVLVTEGQAFEHKTPTRLCPVWHIDVREGKATLTSAPVSDKNSVKICDPAGNELAHETIADWPVVPWV